jgi:hypothetical protein
MCYYTNTQRIVQLEVGILCIIDRCYSKILCFVPLLRITIFKAFRYANSKGIQNCIESNSWRWGILRSKQNPFRNEKEVKEPQEGRKFGEDNTFCCWTKELMCLAFFTSQGNYLQRLTLKTIYLINKRRFHTYI